MLPVVGGTAARYFQEQPRLAAKPVTRQQIEATKRLQAVCEQRVEPIQLGPALGAGEERAHARPLAAPQCPQSFRSCTPANRVVAALAAAAVA
jgi:hypothetical protein